MGNDRPFKGGHATLQHNLSLTPGAPGRLTTTDCGRAQFGRKRRTQKPHRCTPHSASPPSDARILHQRFEGIARSDADSGIEYWHARDLQEVLGYAEWRNFVGVIQKAITSCENAGYGPDDHFVGVNKKVALGSGAEREVEDFLLTRYACYLIAQNGDPGKDAIAFAQTYFAVQTRKQELIAQRIDEGERISARKKLTESERALSGIIFERVADERSFGRIRSKGDRAAFGGRTTQDMKGRLGVPTSRPLADFLPTLTIKPKDFAN